MGIYPETGDAMTTTNMDTVTIIAAAISTMLVAYVAGRAYLEARRANARINVLERVIANMVNTFTDGCRDIVQRLDRLEKTK